MSLIPDAAAWPRSVLPSASCSRATIERSLNHGPTHADLRDPPGGRGRRPGQGRAGLGRPERRAEPEAHRERGRARLGRAEGPRPPGGAAAHRHPHARRRADRRRDGRRPRARWSIARSRRRMRSARPPTRSASASRRCRSCASPPRRPASSSRRSTWRCSASPAGRPRRRRARARPRTRWRRWASRCATRAATCAAARTCSPTSPTPSPASRIRPSGCGSPSSCSIPRAWRWSTCSAAAATRSRRCASAPVTSASSWTSTWCAMPSGPGPSSTRSAQVISANLTRAALEAAPVIADLSSWLADVAGKAGIAWERLFDAPEEKSLRTLRYELDLASSTIEKLEGRIQELRESPTLGFTTFIDTAQINALETQARRAAPRPRSDPGPDRVPRRAAGHRCAGSSYQRPLPTTPRACRTGRRTWSGSRASSRARCSTSRTRAARGSSPSTSAGSPRSRRCGPRTAATPQQVDQLIAQSAAVRDAQLSQLRAKEVEAAEKVRAANERVVASLEAERAGADADRARAVRRPGAEPALGRSDGAAATRGRAARGRAVRRAAGAPGAPAAPGRGPLGHRPDPDGDRAARGRDREAERAARSGRDRSGDLRPCGGGRERPRAPLEPGVDRRRHAGS